MALNTAKLKLDIISILNDLKNDEDQQKAIEKFGDKLTTAIDNYVKTATVSTTVVGSCPAGAVTGTGTGTLS